MLASAGEVEARYCDMNFGELKRECVALGCDRQQLDGLRDKHAAMEQLKKLHSRGRS
jgi:hypothetical protein